jgi:hypothetical protein
MKIAEILLHKCRLLYVMVSYREMMNGKPLEPGNDYYHKTTFDLSSFGGLDSAFGCKVTARVIRVLGAWGPSWMAEFRSSLGRYLTGRPLLLRRQVVLVIAKSNLPS